MQLSFSILHANGEAGKVYTVEGSLISFGRSDECDVQIDDGYVSGRHAEIQCVDGRFYLHDLKSTNGTWLKDVQIHGRLQIQENAVVEFGKGGPKVRVVSILGQGAGPPKLPTANSPAVGIKQDSLNTVRDPRVSKQKSNLSLRFMSFFGVGCIAVAFSVVLVGKLLRSTEVQPPVLPLAAEISSQDFGKVIADEETELITDQVTLPAVLPQIDYGAIAESVRDQCVWIGLKSSADGQTEILPFCAGWSPTGSYVVTTGTAVQIIQKRKWSVVVFSQLLGESDSGGFAEVDQFWVHPEFTDSREEHDVGIIRLPASLPLKAKQLHQFANDKEWKDAFSTNSSQKTLRCGYLIPAEPKAVSSISMPEYAWSIIESLEPLSSGSLVIHPLIKTSGMPQKIHGHVAVSTSGQMLGTFYSRDSNDALIIPVDRTKDFTP